MSSLSADAGLGLMMYVPGGVHEIHCGLGDNASAVVTIKVDAATANVLNASLADVNARFAPQRALFDKEHEGKEAMAWPVSFEWKESPQPGVYARAEWSDLGRQYVDGKVMRAFSGSFFTDADLPKRNAVKAGKVYAPAGGKRGSSDNPARITGLDFPYAGTLTNNPAFRANLPLWAKHTGLGQGEHQPKQNKTERYKEMRLTAEQKAALQAKVKELEQNIPVLKAKEQTAETAAELETAESELATANGQLASDALQARNEELENALIVQRQKDADEAVKAAVKRGAIAAKDEALQATWKQKCAEDPSNIVLLAAIPGSPALQRQRLTLPTTVTITRDSNESVLNAFSAEKDPLKRAALYATIRDRVLKDGDPVPLRAANSLGTLAGTIVTQRTLELLKLTFPVLGSISTDFSDQQAKLNQTIESRIVSIPAVQDYDPNSGWADSGDTTTDVPVTLNKQQGVPITFTADVLASTARRLFDEIAPAQAYALAKSMVDGLYALFLAANYTEAAIVSALIDFGRPTLIDTGVALDANGVPDGPMNRFCLLNGSYFGQLKKDPAIVSLAAFQEKAIIEAGVLPEVEGFRVIKAVNMPATANLVGFAGSKSSALIATRLDSDYTSILPGASYGNVTTVTDPDLGISVLQVQYVNHQLATATQRISLIWGVAKGQVKAARLLKSA
jgi:hypothetical protein